MVGSPRGVPSDGGFFVHGFSLILSLPDAMVSAKRSLSDTTVWLSLSPAIQPLSPSASVNQPLQFRLCDSASLSLSLSQPAIQPLTPLRFCFIANLSSAAFTMTVVDESDSVFGVSSEMHRSGEIFNCHTCTIVLQDCGFSRDQNKCEQVHALVIKSGFEMDLFVGTYLWLLLSILATLWDDFFYSGYQAHAQGHVTQPSLMALFTNPSQSKPAEEREKQALTARPNLDTRKIGRKLVRPRLERSREQISDVDMLEIEGVTTMEEPNAAPSHDPEIQGNSPALSVAPQAHK